MLNFDYFIPDGVEFGWQPIRDQYERDQERAQQNLARRVPAWFKLQLCPQGQLDWSECSPCKNHVSKDTNNCIN